MLAAEMQSATADGESLRRRSSRNFRAGILFYNKIGKLFLLETELPVFKSTCNTNSVTRYTYGEVKISNGSIFKLR